MAEERNLTANFTANASGFAAGADAVRQKLNELNTALEQNRQKISAANAEIRTNQRELNNLRTATQNGQTATAEQRARMQELEDSIAQTTVQLGSYRTEEARLRGEVRSTTAEMNNQTSASDNLKSSTKELTSYFGKLSAGAVAVVTALFGLTAKYGAAADDINTMSKVTGLATEDIQKFQYAADLCDVSLETVTGSLRKLKNNMWQAQQGTTEMQETFKRLGIEYLNGDGSLRNANDTFYDMLDALSKIENETQRDADAMKILGRSATDLNPIIADSGKQFREVSEQMSKYILPQETLDRLNAFNDKIDVLKARGTGTLSQIAAEFSGSFDPLFDTANDFMDLIQQSIDDGSFTNFAGDLAGVIEDVGTAVGNTVKFMWDFRDVIVSGAAALITFKGAIAIGNVISATVATIRAFKGATDAATASQAVFNTVGAANPYVLICAAIASVVIGLGTFVAANISAGESVDDLRQKADELNQTAKDSKKVADDVKALADEYKELKQNSEDTEATKDRLKQIQDTLIESYGLEGNALDLVNGKYEEQLGLINKVIEAKNSQVKTEEELAFLSAQEVVNQAESVVSEVKIRVDKSTFDSVEERDRGRKFRDILRDSGFDLFQDENAGYNSFDLSTGGTIKGRISTYDAAIEKLSSETALGEKDDTYKSIMRQLLDEKKRLEQIQTTYKEAYDAYYDIGEEKGYHDPNASYAANMQKKGEAYTSQFKQYTAEEKENLYNSEKELLKYRMDMGEIGEAEYYNMLAQLRDKYLEENTKAWRDANVEIHKYLTKDNTTLADVVVDDTAKVKDALSEMEQAYKDTLNAIDEEIRAHNRENEDEELQKKIDAVTVRLQYAKLDEFSKYELEKELKDLENERDELEFDRSMEDKKATAEEVYTMAKEASDVVSQNTVAALQAATNIINALGGASNNVSSNVVNNTYSDVKFVMNTIDKTIGQIVDGVTKAFTNGI